jgi:hypothetical protein
MFPYEKLFQILNLFQAHYSSHQAEKRNNLNGK